MKRMLHDVTGKNRYCGPTAMATILGITTDQAAALIRAQSGQRAVRSTFTVHLMAAMRAAGCKLTLVRAPHGTKQRDTLASWLRTRKLPSDMHVIVTHGNHYGVILGKRYLCSLTKRQTVGLADIPKRRARVEEWIIVESLPAAAPVVATPARKPDTERVARKKAKELAARHAVGLEVEHGQPIVWGPSFGLEPEDDPYDGDHYCDDWADALERIEKYIDIANAQLAKVREAKAPPVAVAPAGPPQFPVALRKMWTGAEVQEWINRNWPTAEGTAR
jgi:hypothetical protein